MFIGWPEKAFETVLSSHPPTTAFRALDELPSNLFPLPNGSCQTRLVTLVKGWSYIERAFSPARFRGFCGPIAFPLAFSSDPDELSMAFDHVKEFKNSKQLVTRRSRRTC